jgi:HTH-type transcriptional regulator/antitoxin HigA
MTDEPFGPDWVVKPGATLKDWIEENGLSERVTARLCAMEQRDIQALISGRKKITKPVAAKLEAGTQISAKLWLNLERAYRAGLKQGKKDT